MSFLAFTVAGNCRAEMPWPIGEIRSDDELHERFGLGQIPPDELIEIRVVRLPDTLESFPSDWSVVRQAAQEVVVQNADIQIVSACLLKSADSEAKSEEEPIKSPCPVMGAIVGHPQPGSQEVPILFFYLYEESMVLVSPSGWSVPNNELRKTLTTRFPELLRRTRGARLTREDAAERDIRIDRIYYRDGSVRTQVPLKDGKRHGLGCNFFSSGGISLLLPYSHGEIDGTVRSYTESGSLLSEADFDSGLKHGVERFYNEKGELIGSTRWFRGDPVPEESRPPDTNVSDH